MAKRIELSRRLGGVNISNGSTMGTSEFMDNTQKGYADALLGQGYAYKQQGYKKISDAYLRMARNNGATRKMAKEYGFAIG